MSISSALSIGTKRTTIAGKGSTSLQPRATSLTFSPGGLVARRNGSQLAEVPDPNNPRTDLILIGTYVGQSDFTASGTADSNGGSLNTDGSKQSITISPLSASGTGWFSTGTGANQITTSMIDQPAFIYDNDTYYATDANGTLSFGGWVVDVDANTGKVAIKHSEQLRQFYDLFSAGAVSFGYTQDDTVRAVATNMPAGTFSGGVLTITATGAFSTAQDGVTLAVGDKFILPAGTIGSLTVSAANSGVYEVTSLAATGTHPTFTRTAKWAHGATITPETRIRVGGEGTLFRGTEWFADPATATKVVGTDDPILYPRSVTQQVTLASSTATITNVPIKSASKSNIVTTLAAAGGTQTSTVAYGPIVAPTPGGIGTASLVIDAIASGQTKNGTADTSTVNVTIIN